MMIEFGIQWAKGFLFGIRHFQPEEHAPYYEIQIFLGLIQIFIIIHNGNTNSNNN
jgi:hypothetical protein